MKRRLGLLLALAFTPSWAQEEPAIDPEALRVLETATNHFARMKRFVVVAEVGFDVVQDNGQKIEFGGVRTTLVQRPNQARINSRRRDGVHTVLILDGKNIWYDTPGDNAYGTAPQPGDLDSSLDFVADELDIPQPLSDFLGVDPYKVLTQGLTAGDVVGPSEIDGVACTHLAFRNDVVDFQLWVAETGQLRNLVITYRGEPGEPQFWGRMKSFDGNPEIAADAFTFTPSGDAERLQFFVPEILDADSETD
jgi:hypothetical protein